MADFWEIFPPSSATLLQAPTGANEDQYNQDHGITKSPMTSMILKLVGAYRSLMEGGSVHDLLDIIDSLISSSAAYFTI